MELFFLLLEPETNHESVSYVLATNSYKQWLISG